MADWIDVCNESDFKNGDRHLIELDDTNILVFKLDDNYFAIDHMCTHADFELDDAEIDLKECSIICPLHGAKFCIKSGKALSLPAFEDLPSYSTRINSGVVQVLDEPN